MGNRVLGSLTIGYLFCGGAGAGACVVLAVAALLVPREAVCAATTLPRGRARAVVRAPLAYVRLFAWGYVVAFGILFLGALMLLLDVGSLAAPAKLAVFPTFSFITVGFWALAAAMALSFLLALAWGAPSLRMGYRFVRACTWGLLPASAVVVAYTGLLLSSMPAVPFWSSPWLAALFALSALSCGCAIVVICAGLAGVLDAFSRLLARVMRIDIALIILEVIAVVALMASALFHPYAVAATSASQLLEGPLQAPFLLGFAGIGLVVPIVVEVVTAMGRARMSSVAAIAAPCVLVGGFIVRYCIVMAGAHPEVWTVVS